VHGLTVATAAVLAVLGYAALALIALIAGTLVVSVLRFGEKARLSAIGVLYVGLPAVSLISLRGGYEPYGLLAVLFVILAVIATDTVAYFAGRAIGGPKLWPRVSPNKPWSGLVGGVAGAAMVGAVVEPRSPGASASHVGDRIDARPRRQGWRSAESLKRGFGAQMRVSCRARRNRLMDGLVVAAVAADRPGSEHLRRPCARWGSDGSSAGHRLGAINWLVGNSTLDLIAHAPEAFEVVALTRRPASRALG
jgi:phosphatidate cytidylyltransferase